MQQPGTPEGAAAAQGAAASSKTPDGAAECDAAADPSQRETSAPEIDQDNDIVDCTDHGKPPADDVTSGRVAPQIRHASTRGNENVRPPGIGPAVAARPGVDRNDKNDKNSEFTEFMRAARDPLHRMAFLLCGDRHRAEELTQQTFERCYRHWHKARQGDPLTYARRILANLRIDTWRRHRREVLAGPEELLNEPAATRGELAGSGARTGTGTVEDRDAVVRALLQLPLKQRRVVVMRHLLDLSEHEVADELRIPLGTVKSTASRGLSQLRVILESSRGGAR